MLTKKAFIAAAQDIANIADPSARRETAERMARVFRADNPRFDMDRFLTACNIPPLFILEAIKKAFPHDFAQIIATINHSTVNGCWLFPYKGTTVGVEYDGHIHS